MRFKKIMVLTIILVSLLAVSTVSAAENNTSDFVGVDNTTDKISNVNDATDVAINDNENDYEFDSSIGSEGVLTSNDNEILSHVDESDVLGASPPCNAYSVSVSDTTINYGSSGSIVISVSPCSGYSYAYDFYLRIYDSNNNQKSSKNYYSSSSTTKITHTISANELSVGTYTIKLVNYADNYVMDTATLMVKSGSSSSTYPSSSDYSVSVSDTTVNYGSSGSIYMTISPASRSSYKYDFYLKVYDSRGNQKISQEYYGTSAAYSKTYSLSANKLSAGTYTIKIVNYYDNNVMDTATLMVKSGSSSSTYPSSSDYSVSVSDTTVNYGSSGSIYMTISPASRSSYKYDFYLRVFDSSGTQKISQQYFGTSAAYSKTYSLSANTLSAGTYTIKIVNYYDNNVMDTSTLTIKPTIYPLSSKYSVSVSDTIIFHGDGGNISMSISPSYSSTQTYCYYFKVYDSSNNLKISKLYNSTTKDYYKTYNIIPCQLPVGAYTIKLVNYAEGKVMDTAKLTVKKINTFISAKDINTVYGYGGNLIVTLKDNYNNIIIGKTVSVNLNGKTYSDKTNSKGQIYVGIPNNLIPKTYDVSIRFEGDNDFSYSYNSVKVVVAKITPKITIQSITGNPGKKVKLIASVKDQFGNNIKHRTVTFKVNGIKYAVETNYKGIATLKIKIPKAKLLKVSTKIKKNIVTKTTAYKKTYACTAKVFGDDNFEYSSSKFLITSKDKKTQKYKIVKKQTKTITIPYKKWGYKEITSGNYIFGILHEQREGNKITVLAGDKLLQKFIKFSSKAYYINNGEKIYPWKNKWLTSKNHDNIHEYYYTGDAKIYIVIKYVEFTYKKI